MRVCRGCDIGTTSVTADSRRAVQAQRTHALHLRATCPLYAVHRSPNCISFPARPHALCLPHLAVSPRTRTLSRVVPIACSLAFFREEAMPFCSDISAQLETKYEVTYDAEEGEWGEDFWDGVTYVVVVGR